VLLLIRFNMICVMYFRGTLNEFHTMRFLKE